jgi:uncharacterized membrane protein YhaH (DUF805 family)
MEMKKTMRSAQFCTVLALVNVVVLIYPIKLLVGAESAGDSLIAALMFIGLVFLLVVVDAVSLVVAGVINKE